ncbi:hypothetical protein Tco_1091471 [Tanacetum coccineum]|uniref:Reverse transcriptase domain-containing protein n=1 Tax=Tanacetum coccineum TaxID=301880 RepID=A0ABQ5I790_9ASTR
MRQRRWIELFNDFDSEIPYHLRKANVVADALSRKERVKLRRARAMSMTISQVLRTIYWLLQVRHPRVEVGDKVMLEVSSWKDEVHFGKKEMLAPRYKYLADTNLHVHLEEIKVDKTLCFVEEPVEIIDREVESLKRSRIPIVKSIGTRSEVMRIS